MAIDVNEEQVEKRIEEIEKAVDRAGLEYRPDDDAADCGLEDETPYTKGFDMTQQFASDLADYLQPK